MNKKTILLISGLVAMIVIDIAGSYYLVNWRNDFWSAIKAMDLKGFWHYIGTFSAVVSVLIFESAYYSYLINYLSIHSRTIRVHKLLEHPIARYKEIPNYPQRFENDTWMYYNLGYTLLFGLLKSVGTLVVLLFLMLHMIHNPVTLAICSAYVVIATIASRVIAKPLIKINYDLQALAADFRQSLCLIKFKDLNSMNYLWAMKTKMINLFQALFEQSSIIIPYIILAGAYFSKTISFGELMAVASLIGQVIQTAGYVIASQDSLNNFHSCRIRLKELDNA